MITIFMYLLTIGIQAQTDMHAKRLMDALGAKDLENSLILVQNVDYVDYKNKNSESLLMRASILGFTDVCKTLMDKGANINLKNTEGFTALDLALQLGHMEVAKLLLNKEAKPNAKLSSTQISEVNVPAPSETNVQSQTHYKGTKVSSKTSTKAEELCNALINKDLKNAVILVQNIDSVNFRDNNGNSLLMLASLGGFIDVSKLLIEKGAKLNLQNPIGGTALVYAIAGGHIEIINLLLNKGANLNLQDNNGATALFLASQEGYVEIVKILLDKGAKLDLQAINGYTALIAASNKGNTEVVRLLLNNGAKLDLQSKDGQSPLIVASRMGHTEVVKLLMRAGANTKLVTEEDKTANEYAIEAGHYQIVSLLEGKNPLDPVVLIKVGKGNMELSFEREKCNIISVERDTLLASGKFSFNDEIYGMKFKISDKTIIIDRNGASISLSAFHYKRYDPIYLWSVGHKCLKIQLTK
jgi:uncharacterized protein